MRLKCFCNAGNSSPGISEPDEQKMKDATDAMKSLALGGGDAPEDILQNSQDMMVAIATQPGELSAFFSQILAYV